MTWSAYQCGRSRPRLGWNVECRSLARGPSDLNHPQGCVPRVVLAISALAPGICRPNCFRKAFSYLGLEIAGCCSPTAEVAALLTPSRAIWPITFAALTSFGVAPTISTSYICQHRATFVSQERGAGCSLRDCFQWRIGRMMCIDMKMTRASSILISVLSILELSGRMLYRSGRNLRVIAADKVGFR